MSAKDLHHHFVERIKVYRRDQLNALMLHLGKNPIRDSALSGQIMRIDATLAELEVMAKQVDNSMSSYRDAYIKAVDIQIDEYEKSACSQTGRDPISDARCRGCWEALIGTKTWLNESFEFVQNPQPDGPTPEQPAADTQPNPDNYIT